MQNRNLKKSIDMALKHYGVKGDVRGFGDIGFVNAGTRTETYLVNVAGKPIVWKRYPANFSPERVLLQTEISDVLINGEIPTPNFLIAADGSHIFQYTDDIGRGRIITLQKYRPSEHIEGKDANVEQCCSAIAMQGRIVKELRGKSFKYEKFAPEGFNVSKAKSKLESLIGAKRDPKTGTSVEEEKRIKEKEIPRLLEIANRLSKYDRSNGKTWIHGDFTFRNIGYGENDVSMVYRLDNAKKGLPGADLVHTIDMFCISREEPVFDENAPVGAYRTSQFTIDIEKAKAMVDETRDSFSPEEIAAMPDQLAIWALNGLAMVYENGLLVPGKNTGFKKLSREFMHQTRLDICLYDEEFRRIFENN